jgi:hypothetical protein
MIVHACNPSYSRSRDRRIINPKPTQVKVSKTKFLKGVWGAAPGFEGKPN